MAHSFWRGHNQFQKSYSDDSGKTNQCLCHYYLARLMRALESVKSSFKSAAVSELNSSSNMIMNSNFGGNY